MKLSLLLLLTTAAMAQSYSNAPQIEYPVASIQAPAVIWKPDPPEYTTQALKAGVEGTVVLSLEVSSDGRAHRIKVVKGLGYGLDAKAVITVRKWRFQPGTKDGHPAAIAATVEVMFRRGHAPGNRVRI